MSDSKAKINQARLLYRKCDPADRGYLTKEDMLRLQSILPLDEEQLDAVFASLDQDGDERLTFEEFYEGICPYLGACQLAEESPATRTHFERQETSLDNDDSFLLSFQSIGSCNAFQDLESIRAVWYKLRKENPALLTDFETVLTSIGDELVCLKQEFEGLESTLKQRVAVHEKEVQRLYEETENQIRQERDRIITQEKVRERELRNMLESQLREKEGALQEIIKQHEETQKRLTQLNAVYVEAKERREEVTRERRDLEYRLDVAEKSLHECQDYITVLSRKARDERRVRARAAMELSEGIALEREALVRQLDELRAENHKLRDERDESLVKLSRFNEKNETGGESLGTLGLEFVGRESRFGTISQSSPVAPIIQAASSRRGSVMDAYFAPPNIYAPSFTSTLEEDEDQMDSMREREDLPSPDGAMDQTDEATDGQTRVFNVIAIGNSGVGKTSIIKQFVKGVFNKACSATVGVDVNIKTVNGSDGVKIVLQIWDTAGQERFRSITKQYYRKADGIVLVYAATEEMSYLDLRGWMTSINDAVESEVPVLILANKMDLPGPKVNPETARIFAKAEKVRRQNPDAVMVLWALPCRGRPISHIQGPQ